MQTNASEKKLTPEEIERLRAIAARTRADEQGMKNLRRSRKLAKMRKRL